MKTNPQSASPPRRRGRREGLLQRRKRCIEPSTGRNTWHDVPHPSCRPLPLCTQGFSALSVSLRCNFPANPSFPSSPFCLLLSALCLLLSALSSPAATLYVDLASTNPTPPYTNWVTAATNIQDAIDASTAGDLVLVTNGIYDTGGRVVQGALTNRVAITNAITVQSVNGPDVTTIVGAGEPVSGNGDAAVRCVYLGSGAVLCGFTLTNGHTRVTGDPGQEQSGGGLWCDALSSASNCLLTGNSANFGGGSFGGRLENCVLSGNSANTHGGGAYGSALSACSVIGNAIHTGGAHVYGGGAYGGTLDRCLVVSNSIICGGGYSYGGGVCESTLSNCLLVGNSVSGGGGIGYGGGAYSGTQNGCTISDNSASGSGGGVYNGVLNNCIVYFNSAPSGSNHDSSVLNYSCTTPLPDLGSGNINADPELVNRSTGDYRLLSGSPCLNTGAITPAVGSTDLDGNPRVVGAGVDLGAYELQSNTVSLTTSATPTPLGIPVPYGYGTRHLITGTTTTNSIASPVEETNGTRWACTGWSGTGSVQYGTTNVLIVTIEQDSTLNWLWQIEYFLGITLGGCGTVDKESGWFPAGVVNVTALQTTNCFFRQWTGDVPAGHERDNPLALPLDQPRAIAAEFRSPVVHYVDSASLNAQPPYTSWETAAVTIQDAVDASEAHDTVLVADGVYSNGGRALDFTLVNRVAITNAITVMSTNGPDHAFIVGGGVGEGGTNNGDGAVRCAYVGDGARLIGFTLANGHTWAAGWWETVSSGGGAWCSHAGILSNCVLTGNSAAGYGGGVFRGTLYNCALNSNSAAYYGGGTYESTLFNCLVDHNVAGDGGGSYGGTLHNCILTGNSAGNNGGGAAGSTLNNCVLTGNSADRGGGSYGGNLHNCSLSGNSAQLGGGIIHAWARNCIAYYNSASGGANWLGGSMNSCCTTPFPPGSGNITNEPMLVSVNDPHLLGASPCIGAGTNLYGMSESVDMDGEPRLNGIVDIGADEYWANSTTGFLSATLSATHTQVCVGYAVPFRAEVAGRAEGYTVSFGDGSAATNLLVARHAYSNPGVYSAVLSVWNLTDAASATVTVQVVEGADIYVSPSGHDEWSGLDWAHAKATIQAGVDAVSPGRRVWVTNGVYDAGGKPAYGILTNRVMVDKPVTVCSVNGPGATFIVGQGVGSGGTNNGDGSVRCAYVGDGASLVGFTLTNGHTLVSGDPDQDMSGGGAWCSADGVLSNCVLTGNSSAYRGGGSYGGTFYNCRLSGNSGGGAYGGTFYNSVFTGNTGAYSGGAVSYGTLYNCVLGGNSAREIGGGSYNSTLLNCTLTGNSAGSGGGSCADTLHNCIVYHNSAFWSANWLYSTMTHSCATPLAPGSGNTTNDPRILTVDNPRLRAGSPCIGAGIHQDWMNGSLDMEGEPRVNGVVDIGADEFWADGATGLLSAAISATSTQTCKGYAVSFRVEIVGPATGFVVRFGDGQTAADSPVPSHAYSATGTYSVVLLASNLTDSAGATITVHVVEGADIYVSPAGNDAWTGLDWDQAKATIQAGVDAAIPGATVWVTNGVYAAGGKAVYGATLNRVALDKPVTVRGVNGADATVIDGRGSSRCAYVADGACLVGLTLTNGRAWGSSVSGFGGAAFCSSEGRLSNCALVCSSADYGGGAYGGTLVDCVLSGNSANWGWSSEGGGSYSSALHNCILSGNSASYHGGGAFGGTLKNCLLDGNTATGSWSSAGGGTFGGILYDCVLSNNTASYRGGGAFGGMLSNCVLSGNAVSYWSSEGGGAYGSLLYHCLLNNNTAAKDGGGCAYGTNFSCVLSGNLASNSGGGAYYGLLNGCTLSSNRAGRDGGGAYYGTLSNCVLAGNSARGDGGGARDGSLYSCLLVGNSATNPGTSGGGASGAALYNCTLYGNAGYLGGGLRGGSAFNCIIYSNSSSLTPVYNNSLQTTLNYCCTPNPAGGAGNITNEPQFVDMALGNYRLKLTSPCINRGGNQAWMLNATDLAGNPRIRNGTVDIGAYETAFMARLRVWLQGPYDTNRHAMSSPPGTNISLRAPYATDPRMATAVPSNTTDWVLLELQNTNYQAAAVQSAFLSGDGYVLSSGGSTGVEVDVMQGATLYLAVKHRTHLAVMSPQPLSFTNVLTTYDFTTGSDRYFGGTNGGVEIEPGVWALRSGDTDGDGRITPVDRSIVTQQLGMTGYLVGDLNLDGVVNDED